MIAKNTRINRGVLLAGGTGSRLYPMTKSVTKHLLPVYDKPLIYYSLSSLMLAGIREVAIVTSPTALEMLQKLLGDGSQLGISLTYFVQPEPLGLSDAIVRCDEFIDGKSFALMLGDNIFFSSGFTGLLEDMFGENTSCDAAIITAGVKDAERFGIVVYDHEGNIRSIVEKPRVPQSNRAVTGLYRLPADAVSRVKQLTPSSRGELEITDLLNTYIESGASLKVLDLPRGAVWFDAGTTESMYQATEFVKSYQEASGCRIGCPEEIAINRGWIDHERTLRGMAASQVKSPYVEYLSTLSSSDG